MMSFEDELELMQRPGFRVVMAAVNTARTAPYGLVPGVRQWALSPQAIKRLEQGPIQSEDLLHALNSTFSMDKRIASPKSSFGASQGSSK